MSKTVEERCAVLEKVAKKQELLLKTQAEEIDKLWMTLRRVADRTDKLRLAVPHIQFKDW